MKIRIFSVAVVVSLLALPVLVLAGRQDYNQNMKDELSQQDVEQMYPKRQKATRGDDEDGGSKMEVKRVRAAEVQPAPSQPIYILQQPAAVPQAQVQPITTVESTTVKESRADQLRKQREEVEHQTENKLMERLEDDRLMSEKDRADRLFTPPAPSPSPSPAPAPVTVAPPAAAPAPVVIQPVVTPVAPERDVEPEAPAISMKHEDLPVEKKEEKTKFSVGALAGLGSYPSVNNVKGAYATGLLVDLQFAERLGVEATGLYSSYDVNNSGAYMFGGFGGPGYAPLVTTLTQWNFTGALTYHVLGGRVSPVVGALVGYTRRSYSNRVSYSAYNSSIGGSSAFDGGFLAGVDVGATEKLSIGADIRYLMNLSYRTDDPLAYTGVVIGQPLESLNYYFASLNLKLAL